MDIYGKLNNETIKKEYASIETDTAKVTINNDSDTLKVDVKKVPGKLIIDEYGKSEIDKIFDGSKDVTIKLCTEDSIATLENKIKEETTRATDEENKLNKKIEDEIIRATEVEKNVNERLNSVDLHVKAHDVQIEAQSEVLGNLSEMVNKIDSDVNGLKNVTNGIAEEIENKLDKTGGTITGDLIVSGNLNVSGTTTTTETETLKVKDNLIVTNSGDVTLTNLSGLAINTGDHNTYGIMYDPTNGDGRKSVKLGLGQINDEGEFTFYEGQSNPVATRADSSYFFPDNLIQ